MRPAQRLAGPERPIVDKCLLQVPDHRALDFEVEVLFAPRMTPPDEVRIAQIHAAGKARNPVDDEDLPVVPQIHVAGAPRPPHRVKALDPHARG